MTYQPDIMTHLAGQWAGLHCTTCRAVCTEAAPCACCQPVAFPAVTNEQRMNDAARMPHFATGGVVSESKDQGDDSVLALLSPGEAFVVPERADAEPEVEASAEPQAEVVFITDNDAGVAGESSGG